MKNIVIYGSCATRDMFRIIDSQELSLIEYTARSSFASQFSKRGRLKILKSNLYNLTSGFQQKMVLRDFSKNFFETIDNLDVDCLCIDFIDERCRLLNVDGEILTYSNEMGLTKFVKTLRNKGKFVLPNSDEHFELWCHGWDSFIEKCKFLNLIDKIVINQLYWASITNNGKRVSELSPQYNDEIIEHSNIYLNRLYDYCTKSIPNERFIRYSPNDMVADVNHHWGLAPFHYIDQLYFSTHHQLTQLLHSS